MEVPSIGGQRQLVMPKRMNAKFRIYKSQIPISNDLNRIGFSFFKIIEGFEIWNLINPLNLQLS